MATYITEGFATYQFLAPSTTALFQGTSSAPNFALNDEEPDTTWELGDDVNNTGTNDNFFLGSIQVNLVAGGTIELPVVRSNASFVDPNANEYLVLIPDDSLLTDFNFPASFDIGTLDTSDFTTCFARGTLIATPGGTTEVQDLRIGDDILTADGAQTRVLWVGRQTVFPALQRSDRLLPVRIRQDAFGAGLPTQDLVVTADHGMVVDELVINASALVNGTSIQWVEVSELPLTVVYYHVETENHQVILANGVPTETFVDHAGRQNFDNFHEFQALYGVERSIPEMPRPRIAAQRMVPQEIKDRLGIADTFDHDLLESV
ncbi:Hint domain-containing protein [Tateyamaria sp.]|uniref:Hint domain-containing protein n=1 Tax=Tateyamaria sp. TaxID=1929288 RepID=UPI003B225728